MNTLCSILIPSRDRIQGLKSAVASITFNAPKHANIEFIVRADEDDPETIHWARHVHHARVKLIIGQQGRGWLDVTQFYNDCAAMAEGQYVWIFNDDCEVIGPWFERLVEAPQNHLIQPEFYRINESVYPKCSDIGFPIVRNKSWLIHGATGFPEPIDLGLYNLLVGKEGWPVYFLKDVTVRHNRQVSREEEDRRRG